MRHRRTAVAALATVAISVTGVAMGEAAQDPHRPPCSAHGSRTLYRGEQVRVYETTSRHGLAYDIHACLLSTDRRVLLVGCEDADALCDDLGLFSVRAPWIAYVLETSYHGGSVESQVCVLSLRSPKERCRAGGEQTTGVGVTRAGSMAWMDGYCCRVYKLDAGVNREALLDYGEEIDASSLAVGGQHVYWTKAGTPRSATMP
jgi:hypothetical protein